MFWHPWVGKQFRKPSGLLGHWTARLMARRNQVHYDRVIELLQVQAQDRILEIGCGAGLAIRQLAAQNPDCRIWGLDFSRLMLKKAGRNNRDAVRQSRVSLRFGEFGGFDFGQETFSKIFCINVIYFWEDLAMPLAKIHRLLLPGGRLVIYMSGPERLRQMPFALDGIFNKHELEKVLQELQLAGFSRVEPETVLKKGEKTHYLCAYK